MTRRLAVTLFGVVRSSACHSVSELVQSAFTGRTVQVANKTTRATSAASPMPA